MIFTRFFLKLKKKGGNGCDLSSVSNFRSALAEVGLKDLGCLGHLFTWSNRRAEGFVEERLDRAVANEEWMDLLPCFSVENVTWDSSDHMPIVVRASKLMRFVDKEVSWDHRPFMFEAKWLHVEGFREVVSEAWEVSGRKCDGCWADKVHHCGRMLGH